MMRLKALEKIIVFGVGSNPEPDHRLIVSNADRAPMKADPYRIDRSFGVDFLEFQRAVIMICCPKLVRILGVTLSGARQTVEASPELCRGARVHFLGGNTSGVVRPASKSARASSASLRSWSRVSAKDFVHRASSAISSRMIAPKVSCCSLGSFRAASKAWFSRSVISAILTRPSAFCEWAHA